MTSIRQGLKLLLTRLKHNVPPRRFSKLPPHPNALLTIRLETLNRSTHGELFVGSRRRLATVTSVRFLDAHRLLAAHLVGKRLYLIRFDTTAGTHTVDSCIPTVFGGNEVISDLVDHDGRGGVVVSNFEACSVTLYRLTGNRLAHARDLPILDVNAGTCHGVKFVPPGDVVCATCTSNGCYVFFISVETGVVLYKFNEDGWKPKDVCFIDERRMVVIATRGSPAVDIREPQETKIVLIAFDLEQRRHAVLAEAVRPACLLDCCAYSAGKLYVTDQMNDTVYVYRVDGDTLSFDQKRDGYNFPHGVDVLPEANLLAVTNYGASSITVTRL